MASYTVSADAYAVPLLHAAAHTEGDVAGLLLGKPGPSVEVTLALPVLHRYAALSPTMELGIDMARAYGKKHGLEVVGYYEAKAEAGTDRIGQQVLAALRTEFPSALGLTLENSKLRSSEPIYSTNPAGAQVSWPSPSVREGALKLVHEGGVHVDLRDLDDHLDDSREDWIGNDKVRAAVAKLA